MTGLLAHGMIHVMVEDARWRRRLKNLVHRHCRVDWHCSKCEKACINHQGAKEATGITFYFSYFVRLRKPILVKKSRPLGPYHNYKERDDNDQSSHKKH